MRLLEFRRRPSSNTRAASGSRLTYEALDQMQQAFDCVLAGELVDSPFITKMREVERLSPGSADTLRLVAEGMLEELLGDAS